MDWVVIRDKAGVLFRKYKYVLLVLALGLVLMWLPESGSEPEEAVPEPTTAEQTDMTAQLEQILSQIDGAGKVQVMLTESMGEEVYYQTDDDQTVTADSDSYRSDTVIVTDGDRGQSGLVRKVNPPTYRGAIVVCQGADRAAVRLAIVEAVSAVTGLGSDRISVLKMK